MRDEDKTKYQLIKELKELRQQVLEHQQTETALRENEATFNAFFYASTEALAFFALKTVVADHGPGIPEDELELIFEKFIQSSTTKTGAGGTGLGLAICREIINAHGGKIWAEKNPDGKGTVFIFTLLWLEL